MALIGLPTLGIGCIVAELRGNDQTRWFTRRVFGVAALIEMGVTTTGIVHGFGELMRVVV